MKTFQRSVTVLALLVVPFLGACDSPTVLPGETALSILLTDAPGEFESAVVTIEAIYLQPGPGEDGQRLYLMEEPVTTDLLDLANDVLELVDDVIVPEGRYQQLRFVISGGYIEVVIGEKDGEKITEIYASSPGYEGLPDGRTADGSLQMPSYAQTGIKVNFDGGLHITGKQEILLVDFDVYRSFGQLAGQSGMWVMEPVITGATWDVTSSVTATLVLGQDVELPTLNGDQVTLADFIATLADDAGNGKEAEFVEVDGSYVARFPYLLPGVDWTFDVEAPDGVTFDSDITLPLDLTTVRGQDTRIEVTITGAALTD